MSEFTGERAVITGGGRGIGRACARLVAQRGAAAVLMGHDPIALRDAEAELRADGLEVTKVVVDVCA